MHEMPPSKAYRLLEAGPIVLVTTVDRGRFNIMTMGFHMMVQHAPPLIGCVIGRGTTATKHCVGGASA